MNIGFSDQEGRVLHGLLEDASGDIVVRLDASGFIVHASANAGGLGMDLSSLLLMPHISDFAERDYEQTVRDYAGRVLAGQAQGGWIEFPILVTDDAQECASAQSRKWYSLSLRLLECDEGMAQGALGLLRSVQHKRALEGELNARALTDPLTGLANRQWLCASLSRHLAEGSGHPVAVLAVDRMRAILMQYGQRTADEIQWGFGKFLQTMALPGHEIAQLDSERFVVILTDMSMKSAREWSEDVLKTFAALAVPASARSSARGSARASARGSARAPKLTASAGLARIELGFDWTLRQAELGLVLARAGGGMQTGMCNQRPTPS
jgi:GGDEF domain-containing protein